MSFFCNLFKRYEVNIVKEKFSEERYTDEEWKNNGIVYEV